ncbi:MAG: ATPase, T2SS/T4P/T4SS family [Phycisphaerae bacterium]
MRAPARHIPPSRERKKRAGHARRLNGLTALVLVTLLFAGLAATAVGATEGAADDAAATYYPTGFPPPEIARPGVPVPGLVRVLLLLGFAAGAFYVTHWVFMDTQFVGTDRALWSGEALGVGLVSLAVAFLVPWLYVGLPLGIAMFGGAAAVYVVHRNARVTAPLRVLGRAHLSRLVRRRGQGEPGVTAEPAAPDVTFLGYDAIPRVPEADSFEQRRAALELARMVREAIDREAAAVGVIARPQKAEVRLQVGSEMVAGDDLDPALAAEVIRTIKRLTDLDPRQVRRPQESRIQAVADGRTYDLRIKTAGTVRGEQVAVRIRDQATTRLRLEDLGMTDDQVQALKAALDARPGVVLVSGPKHSGLSTTLHACLRHFDRYVHNVVAFEPAVDLEIENVDHLAVDQEDGPVAASEVRQRLHMEPDVVAFDAVHDADVARALLEGGADRTLVLGLRAADATQALARLVGLLGTAEPLARRLQIVTSQRLVRLLCPACKEAYRPNPEFLRKANLAVEAVEVLYRPPSRTEVTKGHVAVCPECRNHRYVGRTGLFELMPLDAEGRGLLARRALTALRTHCRKLGMRNLQEEGLRLILEGRTSVEEVLRAIKMG